MNDQLTHLIRLQEIDNRLSLLQNKAADIPGWIDAARKSLEEVQARHAQNQAERDEVNSRKREKERELETRESQLSKARDRQAGIKTNKEYQTHLHEIETLMAEKGRVEEELLVLMEQFEVLKRTEVELAKAVKAAEQQFEQERQRFEKEAEVLKAELQGMEKERETVASVMDRSILNRYQNIKSLRRDLAVVPIRNGACGGCHMNIPPQLISEVRAGERILICSQCQRILFWPVPSERSASVTGGGPP